MSSKTNFAKAASLALLIVYSGQIQSGAAEVRTKLAVAQPTAAVQAKLSQEGYLKEMGESVHRLKVAAADLVKECQHDAGFLSDGAEIDFIGGDVIPLTPGFAEGMGPAQLLQPRKKYVDLHMQELSSLIPIVQSEIANITVPGTDPDKGTVLAKIADMNSAISDIRAHYANLQGLTINAVMYDNQSIINEGTAIHQDITQIDKDRKDIYDAIRKN